MSDNQRTSKTSIPPIETGSFSLSSSSSRSHFIGSSSGVFFTHTVFKAFASLTQVETIGRSGHSDDDTGRSSDSVPRRAPIEVFEGETPAQINFDSTEPSSRLLEGLSWKAPYSSNNGKSWLGSLPSKERLSELLNIYFQYWHPRFPFLDGPNFLNLVNTVLTKAEGSDMDYPRSQDQVAQAVIIQCTSNIAAASQPKHQENDNFKIPSASCLIDLVGQLSSSPNHLSLQAMLAAEMYLISMMCLRPASVIHGTLVRVIFHTGLHRCPHRYIQLSPQVCRIRKRIFWCAYILDKYLSVALGIPIGLHDAEVDVCVPGMEELHTRISPSDIANNRAPPGLSPEVFNHLPRHHPDHVDTLEGGQALLETLKDNDMDEDVWNQMRRNPAEFVLTQEITLSRIYGEVLHIFHKSIHARDTNIEDIQRTTCRLHEWWNGLPEELQEESEGFEHAELSKPSNSYARQLFIYYHYSIILLSRPFLSLPPERLDFKTSLQTALTSSRQIARAAARVKDDPFLMSWPETLSAVWMAGLVLSFACLLKVYRFEKAKKEIFSCIQVLSEMQNRWNSSRHCKHALETLCESLQHRHDGCSTSVDASSRANMSPQAAPSATQQDDATTRLPGTTNATQNSTKRRRLGTKSDSNAHQASSVGSTITANLDPSAAMVSQSAQNWAPVLEYTGPDFGFGFDTTLEMNNISSTAQDFDTSFLDTGGGLYTTATWDAYMNSFEGTFPF